MPTPSGQQPPVNIGAFIERAEADCRYGLGRLRLRVTGVNEVTLLPEGPWIRLVRVEIRWTGSDGAERSVFVRVAALGKR